MEQPDFDNVKIVVRSILTSSKKSMTISQLLNDYIDYEGTILPSQQLGYDSCYDLLLDLKDVLKVPPYPNLNSVVELVVNEKTSHIRELISRQKPKKISSKRRSSYNDRSSPFKNNYYSTSYKSHGNNRYDTNVSKYGHNTCTNYYNVRGYDFVKHDSSSLHKPKGFVTSDLQHDVEDLCRKSQSTSVLSLKCYLIDHKDFKKLNVSNIEEAINMLKFFIYIDKGGVHLKNSPHEIFPRKDIKPENMNIQSIINEEEEFLNDNNTDDEFVDDDYDEDYDDDYNIIKSTVNSNYETGNESNSPHEIFPRKDIKPENMNIQSIINEEEEFLNDNNTDDEFVDDDYDEDYDDDYNIIKSTVNSNYETGNESNSPHEIFPRKDIKPENMNIQSIINEEEEFLNDNNTDDEFVDDDYDEDYDDDYNIIKSTVNSNYETGNESSSSSSQSKSSGVFIAQNRNSVVSTANSAYNSADTTFESKFEVTKKGDETSNFKMFNSENIDYKKMISSIIKESNEPITVNQALEMFETKYGYKFPFQKFSCRTCMDYFRLSPAMFKLDNPYSTNSFIRLEEEEQIQTKRKTTIRSHFIDSSIINYCHYDNSEKFSLIYEKYVTESSLERKNHQQLDHNNASSNFSSNPYDEYNEYDSDMVLDSMKEKMRVLLLKHKNGIPCDEFMDVYANEYLSSFIYNEYGFKSMKDMAYQLPSVFFVKENNENNQCILYNAHRRNELENNFNDPAEFYKNIPKTVLYNFSKFFKKYSTGVDLKELKTLYCADFGRSYEPIKYGYSSEKHMFELLNKMVEIHDDKLYTIDPYAYIDFVKNEDPEDQNVEIPPIIPNPALLKYKSRDICGQDFEYLGFKLRQKNFISVCVGEIYNPSFFFIQMASDVNNLNCFMNELQLFYDTNEEKYKVLPEYVQVGLPCASRFEDSKLWHRAKVMKIVDDLNVQVLYVDYGSVEVIAKSDVRLLEMRFGALPIQALPCTLFENNDQRFSRKISDEFAEMVDNNQALDATIKNSISVDSIEKYVVELFLYSNNDRISVNKIIKDELKIETCKTQESVRRMIYKVMANEKDNKYFKGEDTDDENIYDSDCLSDDGKKSDS